MLPLLWVELLLLPQLRLLPMVPLLLWVALRVVAVQHELLSLHLLLWVAVLQGRM